MVSIILPDGSKKEFDNNPTGLELAESIGPGLAKAAVAVVVNGEQRDLSEPLADNDNVSILTLRDEEGLEIMRHTTTAQALARAVLELYPGSIVAMGPTIDNGFYHDIHCEQTISLDDLPKIEVRMKEIIDEGNPVQREIWKKEDVIAHFEKLGNKYKPEILEKVEDDEISVYRQTLQNGESFIDMCVGPHVTNTKAISKSFKLTKVSGAYWRGDSNNEMLQRIYGVSFADDKKLKAYLTMMEEAEKRDHRKIGNEQDLFHFQEEAPGMVFWHPKGWKLYNTLKQFIVDRCAAAGYQEISTPLLLDSGFWEKSGHWGKFRENMFASEIEEKTHALKPMNCPGNVQVFRQRIRSYRELPLRYIEYNYLHRNEPSGALHGMLRLRAFTQDDGHIFCTEDQVNSETAAFCDLLEDIYKTLGFTEYKVKFATRPEKRAGNDETWDKAESALEEAVKAAGLEYDIAPGEGAFYGPKLEFHLTDAIGRNWQMGTIQVDFVLPERLDASYIGPDGDKHRPVLLHRAILGSFERFIGILIENYAGILPLWLCPTQVAITTITPEADEYAKEVYEIMKAQGLRVELDLRDENISQKVKEHSEAKTPIIAAIGMKEVEGRKLAIRRLGSHKQQFVELDTFLEQVQKELVTNS